MLTVKVIAPLWASTLRCAAGSLLEGSLLAAQAYVSLFTASDGGLLWSRHFQRHHEDKGRQLPCFIVRDWPSSVFCLFFFYHPQLDWHDDMLGGEFHGEWMRDLFRLLLAVACVCRPLENTDAVEGWGRLPR